MINALIENLAPIFNGVEVPLKFFEGKMETFLTCRALASFLKGNVLDTARAELVEQASLKAVHHTLFTNVSFSDMELLISELPQILPLKYPVVKNICKNCENIIFQLLIILRESVRDNYAWKIWNEYARLNGILNILKAVNN